MNPEWLMIVSMGIGGILFAVGGTGPKWVRRYVMPFALGVTAYFAGIELWRCIAFWLTLTGTLHLGYGEKLPYWRKALTFIAYVLPTLFIGFTPWQPTAVLIMLGLFALSNWKLSADMFVWKICEFLMGSSLGIILAHLIGG